MPSWSAEAGLLATAAAPPAAEDPAAVTSPGPHAPGTILVLGSKPRPALPPSSCYAALACANASGFSARAHGLPEPRLTVVSAVLGSGKDSDRHSLQAMRGLSAGTLYLLPRPLPDKGFWHLLRFRLRNWRMQPAWVRRVLARQGMRWQRFVTRPTAVYDGLLLELAGNEPAIRAAMQQKRPSTGLVALALGLREAGFAEAILAGFDFTLSHAYGRNPLIDERGNELSKHADTDVAILRAIHRHRGGLWTSEPSVHERTGIPLLCCGPAHESVAAMAPATAH